LGQEKKAPRGVKRPPSIRVQRCGKGKKIERRQEKKKSGGICAKCDKCEKKKKKKKNRKVRKGGTWGLQGKTGLQRLLREVIKNVEPSFTQG